MQRKLVLEAIKHTPPTAATLRKDGFYDLAFNLRTVFHAGYVEVHEVSPKRGTNPYFDEYTNLLADDTDELRWASGGIARGDHKTSQSQQLGRIFARAYLSMHGYTWFPDVKDLLKHPEKGWSVIRPNRGDMPDWLVGGGGKFAVAEAKGTHSSIHAASKVLDQKWRPQVANVEVRRNTKKVSLKSWVIATRWVTEAQPQTVPKQYVEDPEPPHGESVARDDYPSLLTWLARIHTLKNLSRLAQYRVASRLMATSGTRSSIPVATPVSWRCSAPGFEKMTFVGRPLDAALMPNELATPFEWLFFDRLPTEVQDAWQRLWRLREALLDDLLESTWFDGLAVPVLNALVRDTPPQGSVPTDFPDGSALGVSLLSDGSLLAPLSLMEPGPRIEI